jgi:hypothetical protein
VELSVDTGRYRDAEGGIVFLHDFTVAALRIGQRKRGAEKGHAVKKVRRNYSPQERSLFSAAIYLIGSPPRSSVMNSNFRVRSSIAG